MTSYVPAIWRHVMVVFISKPDRNSYSGSRDFRPISITSFLLKTMERLVDRFLRDEILVFMPLHPKQHAYQAGKSVETALHRLVVRVEKALEQQETALGVFLDIEGAFNNTSYDSMCAALLKMGLTTSSYGGLELPWRAAWLRRLSADLLRGLWYLEVAHREVFCRRFYCALMI